MTQYAAERGGRSGSAAQAAASAQRATGAGRAARAGLVAGVGLVVLAGLLAAGCEGKRRRQRAPNVELPVERLEPAVASSLTAREAAPPPKLSELVDGGRYWRLPTPKGPIHVWTPRGYNARRANTVVYVHGYYTHVDAAWKEHRLPSQFAASALNAMFVACEAPAGFGEAVAWDSIAELLEMVEAGTGEAAPRRRIVAVGHSGAYRTLLGWLDEPVLDTVVLLDAAYGEVESYWSWVLGSPRRRLIDVGDDTRQWTEQLHAGLPKTVVLDGFPAVEDEIPRAAARAKILYIRSSIGHFPLVTGGVALPMVLRTLSRRRLLDVPLADLVDGPAEP